MMLYNLKDHKLYARSEYAVSKNAYCYQGNGIIESDGYDIKNNNPGIYPIDILGKTIHGISTVTWCVGTSEEIFKMKSKSIIAFVENPTGAIMDGNYQYKDKTIIIDTDCNEEDDKLDY